MKTEKPKSGSTGAVPDIAESEYRARCARVQEEMARRRLDALLVTSEDNYRYLTGFSSPTWLNLTRPRYCVLPAAGEPILIVPSNNVPIVEATTWVKRCRSWVSPCPEDDGITLTADALKAAVGRHRRIGAELGPQSRLTMPVGDFFRLKEMMAPVEIVDGDWMLRELRMIKSAAEVAHMRHVAEIVSRAFAALPRKMAAGEREREIAGRLQKDILGRGAEKVPYLVGVSGRGGYSNLHLSPGDRVLRKGDVLVFDTGSSYKGYFCDFNREFSFGRPSERMRRMYEVVWRATEAGIAAARPGRTCADVWHAEAKEIARQVERLRLDGIEMAKNGRMGHGSGLRMCEPPSIHPDDMTVLRPGMVLTIEPAIAFRAPGAGGPAAKTVVHEENLVVTEEAPLLLSRRAPEEMPVVA
jgi:Xaa-Pro aminopeptidase